VGGKISGGGKGTKGREVGMVGEVWGRSKVMVKGKEEKAGRRVKEKCSFDFAR